MMDKANDPSTLVLLGQEGQTDAEVRAAATIGPAVQAALSPWRDRAGTTLLWTDQSSNLMSIINW